MGKRATDLSGKEYGRLKVIKRVGTKYGNPLWLCKCVCGTVKEVTGTNLRGSTSSCGCLAIETRTKHGLYKHPLFFTWTNMVRRCGNKTYGKNYATTTVCEEWANSIHAFIGYVEENLGPKPSPHHSIDRIDNEGHYVPGNIRWATKTEQSNNRRTVRKFTYKGETGTLRHFADKYKKNFNTIKTRLFKGQTICQALEIS